MGLTLVFGAVILLLAILLIAVIMIQNPKQGGLSSTFGGGQQALGGVKRSTDILERATWVLITSLILLSLLFNMLSMGNNATTDNTQGVSAVITTAQESSQKA